MRHPLTDALHEKIEPGYAELAARFFKTAPGTYGAGDQFLGIRVPAVRAVAVRDDGESDVLPLLNSPWHEERLLALLILVRRFERGDETKREEIYAFYLSQTRWINNWDLVDLSAHHIVGKWLIDRSRKPLYELARSSMLWERRIAIVSTLAFIREGELNHTFSLCRELLGDKEDLMHKACGWMLREAGKKDVMALRTFLDSCCYAMPRTMLRYAIEKFPPEVRRLWLQCKDKKIIDDK